MKQVNIQFTNGSTRRIYAVKSHEYMKISKTLKVVTEGRTFYYPLENILEIEVVYG